MKQLFKINCKFPLKAFDQRGKNSKKICPKFAPNGLKRKRSLDLQGFHA